MFQQEVENSMQITITGQHVDITEGLNQAVNSKLEKIASHYPDLSSVTVLLKVEKHEQIAEAKVHFCKQDIVAKASTDDLYQSIADMTRKLDNLLQKRKTAVRSHSHDKIANHAEPMDAGSVQDDEVMDSDGEAAA